MKKKELTKMREKSAAQLEKEAAKLKGKLVETKAKLAVGKGKNLKAAKSLRRDIAQIMTIKAEKEGKK